MAYNPYSAIKHIYDSKGAWTAADKAGNSQEAQRIANEGKKYYEELIKNGYGDVANDLSKSNYNDSKKIHDFYAKTGRTATRPYFYSLGKSYGMSESDVDKLLSFDNTTGEITFGGKNIGKPDAVVDGTSYWGDTNLLDNAFSDYISRTGTTRDKNTFVNQENENLLKRLTGELDDLKSTNPFETPEGKAILAKYDLAGLQGRDNAVASGSASNGGNIDSFAASNALRQQASLVSQGQTAALKAHQHKIDNAINIMDKMGLHIDRVHEQNETEKKSQLESDTKYAEITGMVPQSMALASNPYFNSDGTLKSVYLSNEFDSMGGFQGIINDATEKLKTVTDPKERATLEATINAANQARAYKVDSDPKYAQYAGTIKGNAPAASASFILGNKEIDANVDMNNSNNATTQYVADKELEGIKDTNDSNVIINDSDNATTQYVSDNELKGKQSDNAADVTVAGINADADKYVANTELAGVKDTNAAEVKMNANTNAAEMAMNRNTNAANVQMNANTNKANVQMNQNDNDTILATSGTGEVNVYSEVKNIAIAKIDELTQGGTINIENYRDGITITGLLRETIDDAEIDFSVEDAIQLIDELKRAGKMSEEVATSMTTAIEDEYGVK